MKLYLVICVAFLVFFNTANADRNLNMYSVSTEFRTYNPNDPNDVASGRTSFKLVIDRQSGNPKFRHVFIAQNGCLNSIVVYNRKRLVTKMFMCSKMDAFPTYWIEPLTTKYVPYINSSIGLKTAFIFFATEVPLFVGFDISQFTVTQENNGTRKQLGDTILSYDQLGNLVRSECFYQKLQIVTEYTVVDQKLTSYRTVYKMNGYVTEITAKVQALHDFTGNEFDDPPLEYGYWVSDRIKNKEYIYRGDNDHREIMPGEFDVHDYEYLLNSDPPSKRQSNLVLYFAIIAVLLLSIIVWKLRRKTPVT